MNISGHIRKRETKKGNTYQLIIENPTTDGQRKRSYITLQGRYHKKGG